MSKWRKRPVVIDAFLWTGDEKQKEDPEWFIDIGIRQGIVTFTDAGTENVTMQIETLEGVHTANRGDYIIKGIEDELYPCKPDIFIKTYEMVSER